MIDALDLTDLDNFVHGGHFCLGAALARMEIRVMLDALLRESEGLDLLGPVEYVRSNKHSGVRHMPARLRPRQH